MIDDDCFASVDPLLSARVFSRIEQVGGVVCGWQTQEESVDPIFYLRECIKLYIPYLSHSRGERAQISLSYSCYKCMSWMSLKWTRYRQIPLQFMQLESPSSRIGKNSSAIS